MFAGNLSKNTFVAAEALEYPTRDECNGTCKKFFVSRGITLRLSLFAYFVKQWRVVGFRMNFLRVTVRRYYDRNLNDFEEI